MSLSEISQWYHSMATIQMYKSRSVHFFALALHRFRDLKKITLKSRSRSRSILPAVTPFDGKCQNMQTNPTQICASSYRFRDKHFKFVSSKVGHGHGIQFSQCVVIEKIRLQMPKSIKYWHTFLRYLLSFQRYIF